MRLDTATMVAAIRSDSGASRRLLRAALERRRPVLPDADDDMVLETAINGRAGGIVTFNRRDFEPAERLFGIAVQSPGDALSRLERKK